MKVEIREDRAEEMCLITGRMQKVLPDKREVYVMLGDKERLVGWFMANVKNAPLNFNSPLRGDSPDLIKKEVQASYPNVGNSVAPPRDLQKVGEKAEGDDDE